MNLTNDYLSQKAKSLTPYVAGLQPQEPGWVKLNTNESPYPPSPKVQEALSNADITKLRLYPDTDSASLKKAIAADLNINEDNIFCGNGSDEVLALAFQAFYSGKSNILTPDISYGFYPVWGKMYDAELKHIPLEEDLTLNPNNYKNANGVIIANPNAPTSLALGLSDVEKILTQNPKGVVLIDEAYIDFANVESAIKLISSTRQHRSVERSEVIQQSGESQPPTPPHIIGSNHENLLVVRTFSKSHALAGARVGYAIGHPALINTLRQVRDAFNSYPLDMLAQTAATAAIKDRPYLAKTIAKTIATRDNTINQLQSMGYHVLPSQTNFLLMQTPQAGDLYNHLLTNKILARYWPTARLKNYLRVSIGTNKDMEAFVKCVQEYTTAKPTKPM